VIGLFALGLGAWQILLSFLLGTLLLFVLLGLSGSMGEKLGGPFPVMSRIAFGVRGAQLAGLARGHHVLPRQPRCDPRAAVRRDHDRLRSPWR
jgi:cytosine/uracil/thiamine/allantoin permease